MCLPRRPPLSPSATADSSSASPLFLRRRVRRLTNAGLKNGNSRLKVGSRHGALCVHGGDTCESHSVRRLLRRIFQRRDDGSGVSSRVSRRRILVGRAFRADGIGNRRSGREGGHGAIANGGFIAPVIWTRGGSHDNPGDGRTGRRQGNGSNNNQRGADGEQTRK